MGLCPTRALLTYLTNSIYNKPRISYDSVSIKHMNKYYFENEYKIQEKKPVY